MRVSLDDVDVDEQGLILYNDEVFSGTVVESIPDGSVLSEADYFNGLQDGPERIYRADGQLEEERICRSGRIIEVRQWHPNGKVSRLARHDESRTIEDHRWDENGAEWRAGVGGGSGVGG